MGSSEYPLVRKERRIVIALGKEQVVLTQEIAQVQQTLNDVAVELAESYGLDPELYILSFEQRGAEVFLLAAPGPTPEAPPDEGGAEKELFS